VGYRAVCISRTEGAGGAEVGSLVSEQLGFACIDEEIVARAAAKGGISPADVADEERRKSTLARLLQEIGRGSASESYGLAGSGVPAIEGTTPDAIRGLIQETIEEAAGRGEVVIVSHAASLALQGRPEVLRVLVTASPGARIERVSERLGCDSKEAKKKVEASDAARADYLRRFYQVDAELPTYYDLVVNTDVLGVERAAELVVRAAR
jgi:cytidylate kinase